MLSHPAEMGIDFRQRYKWIENSIYFLSREKENVNLQVLGGHPFDRAAPMNRGVIADKLGETKSSASTPTAKTCQARLFCLTHNLMTLMEAQIFRQTGIRNEAELQCKGKTLAKRDECSKGNGSSGLAVLQQSIQRLTQRTVKFIRWLKNHLDSTHSWAHCLAGFAKIYARG